MSLLTYAFNTNNFLLHYGKIDIDLIGYGFAGDGFACPADSALTSADECRKAAAIFSLSFEAIVGFDVDHKDCFREGNQV